MNCGMKQRDMRIVIKREPCKHVCKWPNVNNLCKKTCSALWVTMLVGAMCLMSCKEKKPVTQVMSPKVDTTFVESVPDTTVYGVCGDGCSMHVLELVTSDGDTISYSVNTEESGTVKGGMMVGDRMAVVGHKDADGFWKADNAVNLTTLLGKWTSIDKSFEIQEGGVVVSTITEPKPLTEWKICNGQLVLSADTFSIYELGGDSLYLENKKGIYSFKRLK